MTHIKDTKSDTHKQKEDLRKTMETMIAKQTRNGINETDSKRNVVDQKFH